MRCRQISICSLPLIDWLPVVQAALSHVSMVGRVMVDTVTPDINLLAPPSEYQQTIARFHIYSHLSILTNIKHTQVKKPVIKG